MKYLLYAFSFIPSSALLVRHKISSTQQSHAAGGFCEDCVILEALFQGGFSLAVSLIPLEWPDQTSWFVSGKANLVPLPHLCFQLSH